MTSSRSRRGAGRRVAHPVDLLVDRGFLLDVGVRPGHVGLRLVVVVVGDEILDRVVREEGLELAVELGGERLVRREHQGGTVGAGDDLRHRVGLARAGDAEQDLRLVLALDAGDEVGDGGGLVALRLVVGLEGEADAALALLRPGRTVRHPGLAVARKRSRPPWINSSSALTVAVTPPGGSAAASSRLTAMPATGFSPPLGAPWGRWRRPWTYRARTWRPSPWSRFGAPRSGPGAGGCRRRAGALRADLVGAGDVLQPVRHRAGEGDALERGLRRLAEAGREIVAGRLGPAGGGGLAGSHGPNVVRRRAVGKRRDRRDRPFC